MKMPVKYVNTFHTSRHFEQICPRLAISIDLKRDLFSGVKREIKFTHSCSVEFSLRFSNGLDPAVSPN